MKVSVLSGQLYGFPDLLGRGKKPNEVRRPTSLGLKTNFTRFILQGYYFENRIYLSMFVIYLNNHALQRRSNFSEKNTSLPGY